MEWGRYFSGLGDFSRGGSRPVYKVCTNLSEFSQKFFLECTLQSANDS